MCDEWRRNPLVNPDTGRKIVRNGPVYKKLKKKCTGPAGGPTGPVPKEFEWLIEAMREEAECNEWKKDPLVNPVTRRRIGRNGPVYKKLKERCGQATWSPETITEKKKGECDEWRRHPLVNPTTGRKIVLNGPVYKKLTKKCGGEIYHTAEEELSPRKQREQHRQQQKRPPPQTQPQPQEKAAFFVSPPNRPSSHKISFLKYRLVDEQKIIDDINELKSHDESQWGVCMSGRNNDFRKRISDVKQLGRGSYGTAYKVKFKGNDIVIKESQLYGKDSLKLSKYTKNLNATIAKIDYPTEFKLLALVRKLITTDASPNFVLAYDIGFCNSCVYFDTQLIGNCFITFMELVDSDMWGVTFADDSENTVNGVYSLIFQLLLALQAMETTYGILHNDIRTDNILMKNIQTGGYFKYTIQNSLVNETFYVKNVGFLPMISDFGLASSIHPKYSSDKGNDYGIRCVRIEKDDNYSLTPLNDKTNRKTVLEWTDGTRTSFNEISKKTNLANISPSLDPEDFATYPAFEFFNDIMDVLHMFNNGARMAYVGVPNHNGLINVPLAIVDRIDRLDESLKRSKIVNGYKVPQLNMDKKTNAKFISAVLMVKELYYDILPDRNYDVVASFKST